MQGNCSVFPPPRVSRALPKVGAELAVSIARRATLLDPADRLLLEQLYASGWPATRVAALRSEHVRAVRARASRLVRRILSPAFQVVATRSDCWPRQLQRVGNAVFIRGLSLRAAAKELGLSYFRVSQHAKAIRAIAEAVRAEDRLHPERGAA
ncbi:MAG: hypothetical protein QM783_19330 [Phycisphaerales bacterium]